MAHKITGDDMPPPDKPGDFSAGCDSEEASLLERTDQQRIAMSPSFSKFYFLLLLMYVAYCASIFSTSSVEVAIPAGVLDPALGLDVDDFATGLAAGQVGTVIGKLIVGFFVDSRGPSAAFYQSLFLITERKSYSSFGALPYAAP